MAALRLAFWQWWPGTLSVFFLMAGLQAVGWAEGKRAVKRWLLNAKGE